MPLGTPRLLTVVFGEDGFRLRLVAAVAGVLKACREGATRFGTGVGYFLLVGTLPFAIGLAMAITAVILAALVPGAVVYMAWIGHTDAEPVELDAPLA